MVAHPSLDLSMVARCSRTPLLGLLQLGAAALLLLVVPGSLAFVPPTAKLSVRRAATVRTPAPLSGSCRLHRSGQVVGWRKSQDSLPLSHTSQSHSINQPLEHPRRLQPAVRARGLSTPLMMGKHDLIDFKDVDLDGSACRIGIVKVRAYIDCR